MEIAEAKMIMKEFLEDCDKTQKNEYKTPLRKAFDIAYEKMCDGENKPYITDGETDLICSAIINSPVETSRELQDRVFAILKTHSFPF